MKRVEDAKPENLAQELEEVFGQLPANRLDALIDLKDLHVARLSLIQHEALRLERKLGRQHPRTAQLLARAEHSRGLIQNLEVEAEVAGIRPVAMTEHEAVVEGRFVDEERRGFSNLNVTLEDKQGRPLRELGQAETGVGGYFAIKLSQETLERQSEVAKRGVFVAVRTPEGKLVHRTDEPVTINPGERIDLAGAFSRAEVFRPTTSRTTRPRTPPDDTPWIVRGRVLAANGKPLAGVLVRLFDKDHKFDDQLGAVITNRKGEFEFSYRAQDFKDYREELPDLYLIITDQEGNQLYSTEDAVRFNAGQLEEFEIKLDKE